MYDLPLVTGLQEPVKRILALTETCLVERDPASYNIVTLKPFGEVRDISLLKFLQKTLCSKTFFSLCVSSGSFPD